MYVNVGMANKSNCDPNDWKSSLVFHLLLVTIECRRKYSNNSTHPNFLSHERNISKASHDWMQQDY